MTDYKGLQSALRSACNLDDRYEPLWASYILTSRESAERTSLSTSSFPTYTRHDNNHSLNVISKMEMLIGEKRIQCLCPTDIWLLMMCAHTHDWGMTVTLADLRDHLSNGKLQEHYEELKANSHADYSEAAFELNFDAARSEIEGNDHRDHELISLIQKNRNLMIVLQSYFRRFHSGGYERALNNEKHNNIDKHLHGLVAQINKAHTGPLRHVLELNHKTDGFAIDHAHPRFIAMMLRLADTMDIDSNRVNPYQVRLTINPDDSLAHQEKHLAVERIITTPERVGATFNFIKDSMEENYKEYGQGAVTNNKDAVKNENKTVKIRAAAAKLAFDWYSGLQEELKYLALNWNDIIPENYPGSAPQAKKEDFAIKFNHKEVSYEDLSLRYELNYKRSFEILRGAGLYRDNLTFIREFIQNAMDATKIQLFEDWLKRYKSLHSDESDDSSFCLDPSEISVKSFFGDLPYAINDMAIKVIVEIRKRQNGDDTASLLITDYGTGMSREKLAKLKNVGNIYDVNVEKVKKMMPDWLRPTGAFGIGMQSVFSFENRFTIRSRSTKTNEAIYAFCESTETGGEIFYENRETPERNGTTIQVSIDELVKAARNRDNPTEANVDFFSPDADIISPIIREYIQNTISEDIIPVDFRVVVKDYTGKVIKKSESEIISSCVFEKAFGKMFAEHNTFFRIVKDENSSLAFWYWNERDGVLVYVDVAGRAENAIIGNSVATYRLLGNVLASFKGMWIGHGNPNKANISVETMINAPWCDGKAYLMSGRAEDILSISREAFLDRVGGRTSIRAEGAAKARNSVVNTVLDGFMSLLLGYYKYCKGIPDESANGWIIVKENIDNGNHTALLLSIACDCLRRRAGSYLIDERSQHTNMDISVSEKLSDLLYNHLINKANLSKYEIACYEVEPVKKKVYERLTAPLVEIFATSEEPWFSVGLSSESSNLSLSATNESIVVYQDILVYNPIPLYWNEVFYVGSTNSDDVPIPVYRYGSVARKSLKIGSDSIQLLFRKSMRFGNMQVNGNTSITYSKLLSVFGDRHVFPAMEEFEELAIPYDPVIAPSSMENCGYIIVSPLNQDFFAKRRLELIKKLIKDFNAPSAEFTSKMKQEFYDNSDGLKGFRPLIEYIYRVRKEMGCHMPKNYYVELYIEFLRYYTEIVTVHESI